MEVPTGAGILQVGDWGLAQIVSYRFRITFTVIMVDADGFHRVRLWGRSCNVHLAAPHFCGAASGLDPIRAWLFESDCLELSYDSKDSIDQSGAKRGEALLDWTGD